MKRVWLAVFLGLMVSAGTAAAQCTVPNTLTGGTNASATQVMANFYALRDCINALPTATPVTPQGRLTLVTATPVMSTSQTGKTLIYYTPYVGNQVPIYNGTVMVPTALTGATAELTNNLANGAAGNAGPAAAVADSNYDLFVWNNSGTPTLTRGPAWSSSVLRGTGVGSTELQVIQGYWTNKYAITNGPGVNLGTYVGTIRTNPSAANVDWNFGGVAALGTAAMLGVWNAYNRVLVQGLIGDSNVSWNYSGNWRPANNSTNMRISFVQGQAEDFFEARYESGGSAASGTGFVGVGLGSTTQPAGQRGFINGSTVLQLAGSHRVQWYGFNYMQALENNATGASTFYGTAGLSQLQTGMYYSGRF